MAAYAATVTLDTPKRVRVGGNIGTISGKVNITNYNTTLVAITDITKHFKSTLDVQITTNENVYLAKWVPASSSIEVFTPTSAHTHSIPAGTDAGGGTSGAATAAVATEVADDTDVGEFGFIAYGTV